jgi:hypothetical protein
MCDNHNKQNIDKCMKNLVRFINKETRFETKMSCCGHWRYAPTLIVVDTRVAKFCRHPFDIFSGFVFAVDKKRFYKMDDDGYYFIPELVKN